MVSAIRFGLATWILCSGLSALASVSVEDFGVAGDGVTDDTEAFQNALVAGQGGVVLVPPGEYAIARGVTIPAGTCLEGQSPDAVLLARPTADVIEAETPLITLSNSSTLANLTIVYPDQDGATYYPWTVRVNGQGCAMRNVSLVNCWQGIDVAADVCDLHRIQGLRSNALAAGIQIGSGSSGLLEDIRLGPLPESTQTPVANSTGLSIAGGAESALNLRVTGYKTSLAVQDSDLDAANIEAGSTVVSGSSSVRLTSGVMAGCLSCVLSADAVVSAKTVSFYCDDSTDAACVTASGAGSLILSGCSFAGWTGNATAAVFADCASVIVESSTFDGGGAAPVAVKLGSDVSRAVITGNQLGSARGIENNTLETADITIGGNTTQD